MKQSITQEHDYGCGVACFAFACELTYQDAAHFLGKEQANSNRFTVKHFVEELNRYGKNYRSKHVKPGEKVSYKEGMIVLLRRSKRYLTGHYLIRHNDKWMDPWINISQSKDIKCAHSGYRTRLPRKAMYIIIAVATIIGLIFLTILIVIGLKNYKRRILRSSSRHHRR